MCVLMCKVHVHVRCKVLVRARFDSGGQLLAMIGSIVVTAFLAVAARNAVAPAGIDGRIPARTALSEPQKSYTTISQRHNGSRGRLPIEFERRPGPVLQVGAILVVCAVVAVIILALCDAAQARELRLLHEQRPLEDQIAEIHGRAARQTAQLEMTLNQWPGSKPDAREWIETIIAYLRRLESLAAAPDSSVEEIECLADESARYIREHCLKGFHVSEQAKALAELARRRRAG
jgi:hypothetical protein